jgi:hypothetical protein
LSSPKASKPTTASTAKKARRERALTDGEL